MTATATLTGRVYRHHGTIVLREIAGEKLLVPVRGRLAQLQRLYVLNSVGHYIWEQIDGEADLESIHADMLRSFDVSAEKAHQDLIAFVEDLHQVGLLDEASEDIAEEP